MEKTQVNNNSKFHKIWETLKDKIQKDETGEYVDVDDRVLQNHGVDMEQIDTMPKNASSPLSAQGTSEPRYFLRGFGRGKSKLFRSFE